MNRLLPLHIGAAIAAIATIGSGVAGILDGSWVQLIIAGLCALVCTLLEGIAFNRAMSLRFDVLHSLLSAERTGPAPVNDNVGRR